MSASHEGNWWVVFCEASLPAVQSLRPLVHRNREDGIPDGTETHYGYANLVGDADQPCRFHTSWPTAEQAVAMAQQKNGEMARIEQEAMERSRASRMPINMPHRSYRWYVVPKPEWKADR